MPMVAPSRCARRVSRSSVSSGMESDGDDSGVGHAGAVRSRASQTGQKPTFCRGCWVWSAWFATEMSHGWRWCKIKSGAIGCPRPRLCGAHRAGLTPGLGLLPSESRCSSASHDTCLVARPTIGYWLGVGVISGMPVGGTTVGTWIGGVSVGCGGCAVGVVPGSGLPEGGTGVGVFWPGRG